MLERLRSIFRTRSGPANLGDLLARDAYAAMLGDKRPDAKPPTDDELAETLLRHAREQRQRVIDADAGTRFTLEAAAERLKDAPPLRSRDPWYNAR